MAGGLVALQVYLQMSLGEWRAMPSLRETFRVSFRLQRQTGSKAFFFFFPSFSDPVDNVEILPHDTPINNVLQFFSLVKFSQDPENVSSYTIQAYNTSLALCFHNNLKHKLNVQ